LVGGVLWYGKESVKEKGGKENKMTPKAKKKTKRVCPFCEGHRIVVEECYDCGEFGCNNCDYQGFFVFDCDFCNKPGWEKRIPAHFLWKGKQQHRPKTKSSKKGRRGTGKGLVRARQICVLVSDQEHILLFFDEIECSDGDHQHWYPPTGIYEFPPEEPAKSNAIQMVLGQIETKSGLVISKDQLKRLPVESDKNNIAATLIGLPKKFNIEYYWVGKQNLQGQNIKGSGSQWVSFREGREIVNEFLWFSTIGMN
jgi:hypothetical protein